MELHDELLAGDEMVYRLLSTARHEYNDTNVSAAMILLNWIDTWHELDAEEIEASRKAEYERMENIRQVKLKLSEIINSQLKRYNLTREQYQEILSWEH